MDRPSPRTIGNNCRPQSEGLARDLIIPRGGQWGMMCSTL